MPTARVASVTIGIDDYLNDHYRRPGFALRYAVADAEAFHAYLADSWPARTGATHILLPDREATRQGIDNAFARLSGPERFDLVVLYLAGHGEVGSDGRGWFCAADTGPTERGVGPAELDKLLAGIHADVTILLLDCCYAESVVTASAYFRELGDARGKLFLCSARRDQLTFEDDDWGHGALSFLLLNALAADSPLPKIDGTIAVEGTLFPHLCEQLPLLVFRTKSGAKQEPVMGAISASAIRLPSGSTGVRRQDATVFEVVRARYRQAIAATAVVALIALILNQLLLYHFFVSVDDGYIQVRRGIAPLFWSTIPGYGLHAEIGIDKSDTTPLELGDALLRSGAVWGAWTRKDADHLRSWPGELSRLLPPGSGARLDILIGKDLPESALKRDSLDDAPWRPDIVAEAFMLNPERATQLQATYLSRLPDLSEYDCVTPVDNRVDFTLLDKSSADIVYYLDTLGLYLEANSSVAPGLLESASKLVSYRTRHLTRKLVGDEFDSAVAEYRALLRLIDLAVVKKLVPTSDVTPIAGWCEPAILAQEALATSDANLPVVVERLLAAADPTVIGR